MNFLFFLYLLAIAPKLFWDRISKGKKHPAFLQRLGKSLPRTEKPLIWIHAVSVGEVKAAQPIFRELRRQEPKAFFLITTTTATGQSEAKRSLSEADAFAYLPLDFTWVVRRWVSKLNPKMFILVESDFWPHLLAALRANKTYIALVSGKMSDRSALRFSWVPFFAKKLFSYFDAICVQNEEQYRNFLPFITDLTRLHITGNLKFDMEPEAISQTLTLPQPVITISCTHALEEELLLNALKGGHWFIILAPRHPERFEEVAQLLHSKNIPFSRWTEQKLHGQVLLVDTMGQLPICYTHSRLAIVGGSYVNHIGGHNLLEPCLYGTPVFFGPHTHGQTEFASSILASGAGVRVPIEQLRGAVMAFLNDSFCEEGQRSAAVQLVQSNRGVTRQTVAVLRGDEKTFVDK